MNFQVILNNIRFQKYCNECEIQEFVNNVTFKDSMKTHQQILALYRKQVEYECLLCFVKSCIVLMSYCRRGTTHRPKFGF